ncbi:MAG: hypothetical protein ACREO8_10035 [Luteimonas sp.]
MSALVSPTPNAAAPKSSAAMRYLFLFLIGLVVGVIAVATILRAIEVRKTWQDEFPDAVMAMMQAHSALLEASTDANRCGATDVLPHLQAMRMVSNDIETAYGDDMREDERFAKHASDLRATLDAALASPPLNCSGVVKTAEKINAVCKACHDDFSN